MKKYRILKNGEPLKVGDEFFDETFNCWSISFRAKYGNVKVIPKYRYRRLEKISHPNTNLFK